MKKKQIDPLVFMVIFTCVMPILLVIYLAFSENDMSQKSKYIENGIINENTIVDYRIQYGRASWYDYNLESLDQKCIKNNQQCYSKTHNTCAHRDFDKGSTLLVTNKANNKQVKCRVNDYVENLDVILDLSSHAFSEIAQLKTGIIDVKVELLEETLPRNN